MRVDYDGIKVDWTPAEMRKIEAYRKEAARRREADVRLESIGMKRPEKTELSGLLHDIATQEARDVWRAVWEDLRRMMQ